MHTQLTSTTALRAATEGRNPRLVESDSWSNPRILTAYMDAQHKALDAVDVAIPQIASAAQAMIDRLGSTGRNSPKGRIIYVGAGTSGRIGALDGMELGPTFDWPDDKVVFAIAEPLEFKTGTSRDGLEDRTDLAEERVKALNIGPDDVVIALAASGTTPYTNRFAELAKHNGALVIGIANNEKAPLLQNATHPIFLPTGPEAIAGSSRMGAGTAQKAALNILSSLVMSKLPGIHGVFDGLMVNMRKAPNAKLHDRSHRIVSEITGCDETTARNALSKTEGDIKSATLVAEGMSPIRANEMLASNNNDLRQSMVDLETKTTFTERFGRKHRTRTYGEIIREEEASMAAKSR